MLYFEFNRTGGKEKYIPMTEEAFQQALTQEGRYFIRYEGENYVLESTEQEFKKFRKDKNHSEYVQKNADGRKVVPLSLDTDEIECYDSISDVRSVFHNGDNTPMDEAVLNRLEKTDKYRMLYKAMKQLTPDEQYVILEIFFRNRSQSDVAKESGISKQAVNKKYFSALDKLKSMLADK